MSNIHVVKEITMSGKKPLALCSLYLGSISLQTIILDKIFGKKVKKYSKIGQDLKNVIYNFACFCQRLVSRRKTGH